MLFENFFDWLDQQYDPDTGGFYYARSSSASSSLTPDIESTAQAINLLERCSLLSAVNDRMRQGLIRFFQQKQRKDTGYFLDDHPYMKDDEVMVGRALGYSIGALNKLGAKPLYSLPLAYDALPAHMATPHAYREWLERVEMSNSWRGCDRVSVTAAYIIQMEEKARAPYVESAFDFFAATQSTSSGLWGKGSRYVQLSGTFKLHLFYNQFDRPLPREELIYDSIKRTVAEDEAVDMCFIRNPVHLLSYLKVNITDQELLDLITATYTNLHRLLRSMEASQESCIAPRLRLTLHK